jgi:hypothetical protein
MTFFHIGKKKGAPGAATPGRRESNGGNPMDPVHTISDGTPIGELIARHQEEKALAVSDADLIEARDRMDAGCRLVVPMLFDGLGSDPESGQTERLSVDATPALEVDDAVIGRAADKVAAFRTDAVRELHHLDKHAPRYIHVEALALVDQCDEFLGAVRAYFREQS